MFSLVISSATITVTIARQGEIKALWLLCLLGITVHMARYKILGVEIYQPKKIFSVGVPSQAVKIST